MDNFGHLSNIFFALGQKRKFFFFKLVGKTAVDAFGGLGHVLMTGVMLRAYLCIQKCCGLWPQLFVVSTGHKSLSLYNDLYNARAKLAVAV